MDRNTALQQLSDTNFDVCIIGGGATGAGCALDAALRGLKVCLIEKTDFAAQTSSKSTKLVHGGVRYLEQAVKTASWEQFQMVRKALRERQTILNLAPHLTSELALLTPCRNLVEGMYYSIGLKMYDLLAGVRNLTNSQWLSKKEALERLPELRPERLHSAVMYYDGQLDDARYCLALVRSAAAAGAVVVNHTEAVEFTRSKSARLKTLLVRDTIHQKNIEIKAKVFVNATGPFADSIRKLANPKLRPRMRVSRGSHIVLNREYLSGSTALLVPKTDDGRVLFMIPWQNRTLIGTTDLDDTLTESPNITDAEIAYLLDYTKRYFIQDVTETDVLATFTGQRPLLQAALTQDTKSLVRDHEVELDNRTKLLSIMGGKWTTYRLMARDTINEVCVLLNKKRLPCTTDTHPLVGAAGYTTNYWQKLVEDHGLDEATALHLAKNYGTEAAQVIALFGENPAWRELLIAGEPFLKAEVIFAKRYEMAVTVDDVLFRRLGLGLKNAKATEAARPIVEGLLSQNK